MQVTFEEACETIFVILIHLKNKRIDPNYMLWLICGFAVASATTNLGICCKFLFYLSFLSLSEKECVSSQIKFKFQ